MASELRDLRSRSPARHSLEPPCVHVNSSHWSFGPRTHHPGRGPWPPVPSRSSCGSRGRPRRWPPAADRMPSDVPSKKTPWVLDGEVTKIVQVGDMMVAGGLFTTVARPDERHAVRPAEPVRLGQGDRPGQPDLQPDGRRPGPAAAARADARHRVRRRRLHQDQRQGPQPPAAAQRQHLPGGHVVQGAVDQRRHRDDGAAAQQPAVHRRLLHQDRRRRPTASSPRSTRPPARSTRTWTSRSPATTTPAPAPRLRSAPASRASRPPATACRHRQLPHRRRPGPRPDRDDRPPAPTAAVSTTWNTTQYTPICSPSAFDSYMRDVEMSPDGSYFVVATTGGPHSGTLCDTATRWETNATGTTLTPDLDRQLRRRHAVGRRHHRRRGLRRRPQPLDEQPQRRRHAPARAPSRGRASRRSTRRPACR